MDDLWKPILVLGWGSCQSDCTRELDDIPVVDWNRVSLQGGGSGWLDDIQVIGMLPPSMTSVLCRRLPCRASHMPQKWWLFRARIMLASL